MDMEGAAGTIAAPLDPLPGPYLHPPAAGGRGLLTVPFSTEPPLADGSRLASRCWGICPSFQGAALYPLLTDARV